MERAEAVTTSSGLKRVTEQDQYRAPDARIVQGVSLVLVRAAGAAVRELGLSIDGFAALEAISAQPFMPIPRGTFLRALGALRVYSADPALGLRIGGAINDASMHLFGPLVMVSSSARQVVDAYVQFGEAFTGGSTWQVWQHGGRVWLGAAPGGEELPGAMLEAELSVAFMYALAGRFWGPWARTFLRATLAFEAPADSSAHRELFGDVTFGTALSTFSFPEALLDHERPGSDAALSRAMGELVRAQMALGEQSWSERVRRALSAAAQPAQLDGESLAQRWGLSVRSLRRKLEAEQTSLSLLHEAVLFERARALLARPTLRMHE
ncbi:MAG TPA: AraC family transcriptional regulator ligand-binding domain-containing protein, partial [Polyangiales bacterium]|nr:AraC family transcriptional regulator ligand-binding domain-containing protein [Polyangiales bacterium]